MTISSMFHFSIRDMLWLMVVVALGLVWCCEMVNHRGTLSKLAVAREDLQKEKTKAVEIHVGNVNGTVRRNQRMLVSIDNEGRPSFRPISDEELKLIKNP